MKRRISEELKKWKKQSSHKPLIIRGARQVGKTYSVEEFGKTQFKHFIKIDFEKERNLSRIFEGDLSPDKLFDRILIERGEDFKIEDTLLFFDEIQLCPRALMSLRYFYEERPQSWVIAAGSLLEFTLKDVSFPVGRVEYLWMYPLVFREFLTAVGQQKLADSLPTVSTCEPVDDYVHSKLLELLKTYMIVGGMPEAVKEFAVHHKLSSVKKIHSEICQSYIDDFAKYHNRVDRYLIEMIFQKYSMQIGKHLKYTNLADGKRVDSIKKVCHILEMALVVHKVIASNGEPPLMNSSSGRIFKGLFLDIGLMQYLNDVPYANIIDSPDISKVFKGALSEQFAGQQIIANSNDNSKLYFWNRLKKNSLAEVDYLWVKNGQVLPVEIKTGPRGSLKSMHMILDVFKDVSEGIVLSSQNISFIPEQRIKFMPLYTEL
jgi:predicted AAA+ superfamily ATPase